MTWMPRPESDARNTSVRTAWTNRSTPMQKHRTASGSASDRGSPPRANMTCCTYP
jgi:hypothetical protein